MYPEHAEPLCRRWKQVEKATHERGSYLGVEMLHQHRHKPTLIYAVLGLTDWVQPLAFFASRLEPVFYERACQEQTSTLAAGQGLFLDSLPPSPSGVAFVPKLLTVLCLRAPRACCGSFGESVISVSVAAASACLKLCRCSGLLWLADWVAVGQPGFYWRLMAYSYLRSCEGAYS